MRRPAARITGIRRAGPDDEPAVTDLLAEAFLHGDLGPWLVPHVNTRTRIYGPYFALHAEHALTHGHVDVIDTDDCDVVEAVAVWYTDDGAPQPGITDYDARLAVITGEHHHRFQALDEAMAAYHPHDQPHHYLAFLAVHPDRQGGGLGGALLQHHHTALDAAGIPAFLEATGSRNRALYARHLYRPKPAYPVARGGPSLYPMWRPPVAQRDRPTD